jgi:opacity protein-like surface antigen
MRESLRLLLRAAALIVTVGVCHAQAQTVILRKVPAAAEIEIAVNNESAATKKSEAGGDVIIPFDMFKGAGRTETDAQVLVSMCENNQIRVLILERGHSVPPEVAGCTRRDMGGWFLVKPVSSLVVDVGSASPTLLLRQGSFSLAPPRIWSESPTGLVLFAGGSLNKTSSFKDFACGSTIDCSGGKAELGFAVGATFWITPWLGAEGSYIRPKDFTAGGSGDTFRFTSTLDAHVITAVGKIGVPAGPARPYGQIGGVYHRATFSTSQTMTNQTESPTQTYSVETGGWSWTFGGGLEIWLNESFAIFGELNRSGLKGPALDKDVEGQLDDRLTTVIAGIRLKVGK